MLRWVRELSFVIAKGYKSEPAKGKNASGKILEGSVLQTSVTVWNILFSQHIDRPQWT